MQPRSVPMEAPKEGMARHDVHAADAVLPPAAGTFHAHPSTPAAAPSGMGPDVSAPTAVTTPPCRVGATASAPSSSAASATPQPQNKRTYADALHSSAKSGLNRNKDEAEGTSSDGLLIKRRRRRRRASTANSLRPGATSAPPGTRGISIVQRLMQSEIGAPGVLACKATMAHLKFGHMNLKASFDTNNTDMFPDSPWKLLLRRRSHVIEIVGAKDLVFALTHTGICAAYSRNTNAPICHMNTTYDEVVRSIFLNKTNDTLITVSVFRADDFTTLHCRSTPLAFIRQRKLNSGTHIFASESLRWPGFVEFDDVNSKVLTFSAADKNYKVWDLATYKHLYTINDPRVHEIKISPGIMLIIYQRCDSHVPLKILDIETGQTLKEFHQLLHRNRKLDFIEQFNEKLLVKQEHENLQIIDVRTAEVVSVARSNFLTPSAFIFLYENHLFLTFRQRQVSVWNFKGELVTAFDDHMLWYSDSHSNSICITPQQDLIMSYCALNSACSHGSINISCIPNGKSVAKVSCTSEVNAHHRDALKDTTALCYNEDRNEIYSGDRNGFIHVWSS